MELSILDISYRWNPMICGVWCLASFNSMMVSRFIHTEASTSSLFYCWSIFCMCPSISWWPSPCCCCYLAAKLYLTPANPWTVAHQVSLSTGFPRKNTGVGCYLLLQGIFPTQGSNLGLLLGRQILLQFKKFLNIQKSRKNSKPYTPVAFIYILSSFSVHIQNTLLAELLSCSIIFHPKDFITNLLKIRLFFYKTSNHHLRN